LYELLLVVEAALDRYQQPIVKSGCQTEVLDGKTSRRCG
jgi:hypothetical protein